MSMLAIGTIGTIGTIGAGAPNHVHGSTAPPSGDRVAQALAYLETAQEPQEQWNGPTEPTAAVAGTSVFIVSCGAASEGCRRMTDGMEEAALALGWTVNTLEPQGTPDEINAAMLRAMDAGADVIIWQGFPRVILSESLAEAERRGVIMVSAQTNEDVANDVSVDAALEGEILANFAIADSEGTAQILMLTDREFPTLVLIDDRFKEVITTCHECAVLDERDVTIAELTTRVVPETVSLLQRYPDATHIYTPYDAMAIFAAQGVREAGRTGSVRIFSEGGNAENMNMIRNDDDFVATVGIATEWIGWASVDSALRLLNGQEPFVYYVPLRLFTSDNVPADGIWQGDLDFRAEYRALWGID